MPYLISEFSFDKVELAENSLIVSGPLQIVIFLLQVG